jgi:hypothetical protein
MPTSSITLSDGERRVTLTEPPIWSAARIPSQAFQAARERVI